MRKVNGVCIDNETYIELLESALIDILDGNDTTRDIHDNTGCSMERCKELYNLYNNVILPNYKKKHGLTNLMENY